ncbi:alpha/beta-hydrolase [Mycena olivaceomarginata]|nr:alpha/beta-hydrolase [Mycena olivaceomarginata]
MLASRINVAPLDGFKIMPRILEAMLRVSPSRVNLPVCARSVHLHYFFPDSRKTFRAGISRSGTSQAPGTVPCEWHDRPGGGYTILSNITDCGSGTASFRCLQDLPFDTFWPLALSTYQPPVGSRPPWSMVCKGPQGSFIDEYPSKKALDGDFLDLPIITGTNLNEGNLLIGASFLDLSPQPVSNSTLYDRAAEWFTDIGFLAPQRQFLKVAKQLPGFPAFLGVFHSTDLYYLDIGSNPVPAQKLVMQMQDFYISFVNDLNPGNFWPKYTEESKIVMRLLDGEAGPIVDTLRRNQTDFLSQLEVMEEFGQFGL